MSFETTGSGKKRAASQPTASETSTASNSSKKRIKRSEQPKATAQPKSSSGEEESSKSETSLQIQEETGDIFDAPPQSLIIHACNCDGSWGGGIAKAFKDRYPKAFVQYAAHCKEHGPTLLDSAQLIPPVDADTRDDEDNADDEGFDDGSSHNGSENNKAPRHFVGCLYTSRHYGRRKDTPSRILAATKPAMVDLLKQISQWNADANDGDKIGEVRMCKINSGLFAVPWEKSKAALEGINVSKSEVKIIKVVSPKS